MSAGIKKAFTLVELLVVIVIIGLLMAILMPALAAARSQGRSLVCKSNLRQLLIANIGYATENDGFYVPAASDMYPGGKNLHRWHGVRESLNEPFDPLKGPLVAYLADGEVKECPKRVKFVKGVQWDSSFEQGCGGYGYNMTYLGSRFCQVGMGFQESYAQTACITEVAKPAETLMFADCAMSKDGENLIEYSFAEPPFTVYNGKPITSFYMSPSIHFRHRGRANIGWTDGHAGFREMAKFDEKNVWLVSSTRMNLGWFEPLDNSLFDLK